MRLLLSTWLEGAPAPAGIMDAPVASAFISAQPSQAILVRVPEGEAQRLLLRNKKDSRKREDCGNERMMSASAIVSMRDVTAPLLR